MLLIFYQRCLAKRDFQSLYLLQKFEQRFRPHKVSHDLINEKEFRQISVQEAAIETAWTRRRERRL